jgi:hypothetical protein
MMAIAITQTVEITRKIRPLAADSASWRIRVPAIPAACHHPRRRHRVPACYHRDRRDGPYQHASASAAARRAPVRRQAAVEFYAPDPG